MTSPHKAQNALDEKAVETAVTFLMETRRIGNASLSEQQRAANDQVMRDAYRDILMKGIPAYESAKPALPAPDCAALIERLRSLVASEDQPGGEADECDDAMLDAATALESLSRQLNEAEAKMILQEKQFQDFAERSADDAIARQNKSTALLRQSYTTLAFAFKRLHESSRSRDGELCLDFQKVRAEIEKHFKEIGVKL